MLAAMLKAALLAVQPDLCAQPTIHTFPLYYLYGEHNDKFCVLVAEISVLSHVIHNAGRNTRRDNPTGVVDYPIQILYR